MFESSLNNPYLVESYVNGNNWYRIYSDGWIEQGGRAEGGLNATKTYTFLKPFASKPDVVIGTILSPAATSYQVVITSLSTTSMSIYTPHANISGVNWQACGYIA